MADRRRRNWLLKALAQEEYESLQPHLEDVDLPLGTLICESGAELEFAYFPESCVVSIVAVLEDGMSPRDDYHRPGGGCRTGSDAWQARVVRALHRATTGLSGILCVGP